MVHARISRMFKVTLYWTDLLVPNTFCLVVLQYDNVLMEESAQILEVESFIPLMLQVTHIIAFTGLVSPLPVFSFLQNPQDGYNQLKRVIMIGDHHQVGIQLDTSIEKCFIFTPLPSPPPLSQLPPVVQNMAFQKYSNMEQSMFARFVRLRVPTVQLDAQGRARPALCQLYNWRYIQYCSTSMTKNLCGSVKFK